MNTENTFPTHSLLLSINLYLQTPNQQESPPAWTQEAYRPPCSKYSLCCPNWVPPRQGTPHPAGPGRVPPPSWTWQGTPPAGYPPSRVPPQLDLAGYPPQLDLTGYPPWQGNPPPQLDLAGYPPPVAAPWHSGKCCKALWDMGTPPSGQTEGQTRVKTLPSRRTTYAGGKNELQSSVLTFWWRPSPL